MSDPRTRHDVDRVQPRLERRLGVWLPLVLGFLLALAALEFIRGRLLVKLEEAALGTQTQMFYVNRAGSRVLCQDAGDVAECLAAYNAAGRPPVALWLGNSQLPAINRPKPGDATAATLLHDALRDRNTFLVSLAQPNANLHEHALVLAAQAPLYDVRLLLLPVFLDDIREHGIRANIAHLMEATDVHAEAQRSLLWPHIVQHLAKAEAEATNPAEEQKTLQRRFEAGLNARLDAIWPLWRQRAHLRGLLALMLHTMRNRVVGINAQTQRKVDSTVYAIKMRALAAMLAYARSRNIKVLLYVPPFRRDIPGPYVASDYARLKIDLEAAARKHDAHFANLEDVVPGPEWGTVVDPIFGYEDYDFMHFTADGHRRLAAALEAEIKRIGF